MLLFGTDKIRGKTMKNMNILFVVPRDVLCELLLVDVETQVALNFFWQPPEAAMGDRVE